MKSKDKKSIYLLRSSMMILTTVLIILFFCIMSLVGKIQGTARVVNYAGLVRGCTQRIIKLEDAGTPRDDLIETVSSIIDGLRNSSDSLNLVRLNDKAFQTKMDELSVDFEDLKSEIYLVREKGYENTSIIEKSENFFQVCDEATGLAEAYSQRKATSLDYLEKIVIVIIIGLVFVIGTELIKALRFAAQNRILQKKVYLDEATGLPNKNKCEEILDDPTPPQADTLVSVCVFDLNNLRTINNNLGHDKGDEYIRTFAIQLRKAVPEEWFVGRDGGDEFIAVFTGADHPRIRECLENIRTQCQEYSVLHPEMPLSYAAGYALSSDFPGDTMRELFRYADKNMYIDKNQAKIQEAQDKQNLHYQLLDFIKEQNFHFSACLYCDALLDQYDVLRASSGFFLAEDGSYSGCSGADRPRTFHR
ncbi:MAG: GGDEF domain-containing protein [Blautia faecis]